MSILFYMRLAAQNIRKNSRTYVPYILTCIGSVMVFNILLSLSLNTDLDDIYGGSNMRMILCLGCIIIAVFTGLFLFYTNSFLIKRRKTEIGLFNILAVSEEAFCCQRAFIFFSCAWSGQKCSGDFTFPGMRRRLLLFSMAVSSW